MNSSLLFEVAVRSGLVLGAGLLAVQAMRRRSAAERHFVLALALGAVLVLPVGFRVLPEWAWKTLPAAAMSSLRVTATVEQAAQPVPVTTPAGTLTDSSRPTGMRLNPWMAIWMLGAALQAGWLALGAWHLHGIRQRARRFDLPEHLDLGTAVLPGIAVSDETRVAFLAGQFRPAIVLPAGAGGWPAEHLRMVLGHELAHLRRRDHWLVPLCGIVRVIYWWHPLAWMALAHLRRERERACDDMVIAHFRATDYAELLLDAARDAVAGRSHSTLAMASCSNIENRVQAILDGSLSRRGTARTLVWIAAMAAVGVAFLASTVRLMAAENGTPKVDRVAEVVDEAKPVVSKTQRKQIVIEAKLVELGEQAADQLREVLDPVMNAKGAVSAAVLERCLRGLGNTKGVDLMSAPVMMVLPGQKAKIGVTRDFKYGVDFKKDAAGELKPGRFEVRPIGVQLEITPTMNADKIVLNGRFRVTDFEGFIDGEGGVRMPVFDVKEARLLREVGDGESIGAWAWSRDDEQMVTDRLPDGSERQSKQTIVKRTAIFLTAKRIERSELEPRSAPKTVATSRSGKDLPYGAPVAGEPGFVTSPYAPKDGSVDIRGFPPNTEVKCPYSGKIFLVP